MEKSLYTSIESKTLITAIVLFALAFVVTRNVSLALGFIIGAGARVLGFLSIVKASELMSSGSRPGVVAAGLYIIRFGFYGLVIALCIKNGINIFSLTAGFIVLNVIIMVTQGSVRGGA